jgi:hypothetical protein
MACMAAACIAFTASGWLKPMGPIPKGIPKGMPAAPEPTCITHTQPTADTWQMKTQSSRCTLGKGLRLPGSSGSEQPHQRGWCSEWERCLRLQTWHHAHTHAHAHAHAHGVRKSNSCDEPSITHTHAQHAQHAHSPDARYFGSRAQSRGGKHESKLAADDRGGSRHHVPRQAQCPHLARTGWLHLASSQQCPGQSEPAAGRSETHATTHKDHNGHPTRWHSH